jgi:hypothetical protein
MTNVSSQTVNALQVNAVFRLVSTNEEIGSGYTGTDRVDELLTNSRSRDT